MALRQTAGSESRISSHFMPSTLHQCFSVPIIRTGGTGAGGGDGETGGDGGDDGDGGGEGEGGGGGGSDGGSGGGGDGGGVNAQSDPHDEQIGA
eukprot:7390583-Prymnesium_polylepis.1